MAKAKKPTKKVQKKAGPKKPAKKRRADAADVVPDVIPMAEFMVVVNNPGHRAMRLSAEATLTQYVQITLDGDADKALIKALMADPRRVHIINVPEPIIAPNPLVRARLDEIWLTEAVIDQLLPYLTPGKAPNRDKGFLINNLDRINILSGQHQGPDSITQLLAEQHDGFMVLNAATFCICVEHDETWRFIRDNTQLGIGPRGRAVLEELARVLRIYYNPVFTG
jgi:hypothetical protein